jgi:pantetheine-phosphate adenylyltransferase
MEKIGVFPGSFDPFTKGHEAVVNRFLPLFDKVIIAMGVNSTKNYLYTQESRINHIKTLFAGNSKIAVEAYEGLTTTFCQEKGARYLLRGLRNTTDFEFEKAIGQMNQTMAGIETLFLMTDPHLAAVHSSIVREIKKNNGDLSPFVTKSDLLIITTK